MRTSIYNIIRKVCHIFYSKNDPFLYVLLKKSDCLFTTHYSFTIHFPYHACANFVFRFRLTLMNYINIHTCVTNGNIRVRRYREFRISDKKNCQFPVFYPSIKIRISVTFPMKGLITYFYMLLF